MQQTRIAGWIAGLAVIVLQLGGCGPSRLRDPLAALADPSAPAARHRLAMSQLRDEPAEEPEAYRDALTHMLLGDGYRPESRSAAFLALEQDDPERLRRILDRGLERIDGYRGLERICALVAERDWRDLAPALAGSWARPADVPDADRPERATLATWYGDAGVVPALEDLVRTRRGAAEARRRAQIWTLLSRLGADDRLRAIVDAEPPADDPMLRDLVAARRAWGIVPTNREEILWVRSLLRPEHAAFRAELDAALAVVPAARRDVLELRDLPVLVMAARVEPGLLRADEGALRDRVRRQRGADPWYAHESTRDPTVGGPRERLDQWRDELTWGDLLALVVALQVETAPSVVTALFECTERDRLDEDTERGGLIWIDPDGVARLREFPPFRREHDYTYIASQALFDAGYAGGFHFHLHAQDVRNHRYAGPGLGDLSYADRTRANCLVFTSIDTDTLGIDFYRHGGVRIDLGTIARPRVAAAD